MEVRDTARSAEKFARMAAASAPDYEAGVRSPRRDWAQATAAAEGAFAQGVQLAVSKQRFSRGVTKAGTAKFQRGAIEKGVARFGSGAAAAQQDWAAGFEPYANALRSTQLPPRKARRDPSNLARVGAVVQAMIRASEGQGR